MNLDALLWERRKRSFWAFYRDAWPYIPGESGNPLIEHWSTKALCDRFERLIRGTLGPHNLCVNIPPGMAKSTIASVALPAWVWLWRPDWTTLMISGAEDVALRDSMKCRELIRSDWYQSSRPAWKLSRDQDGKEWFRNTCGGERQASTILSKGTGKRVHHIGVDDPNDSKEVSDAKLAAVWDAWSLTYRNRLKDMTTGTRSLIQQRLHMQDLTGHIMEVDSKAWAHVVIRQKCESGDEQAVPEDPRTQDGELLFPQRFPAWVVEEEERNLQSFGFAGQHQQRPIPREGGTWKVNEIEIIDVAPAGMVECRGWDLAASQGKGDWCCGARLGRTTNGDYVIVDMVRQQTGEPRKLARSTASVDGVEVRVSVPQDPGQAGKDQVRSMTAEFAGFSFSFSLESGPKRTRWEPFQSQVNGGRVKMVRGPWNAALLDEMRTDGQVHDDQLDALARAFSVVVGTADVLADWVSKEAKAQEDAAKREMQGEPESSFRMDGIDNEELVSPLDEW